MDVEKIREQFPVTRNRVFMNHAAQSPLPKPVADVVRRYVDDFSNFGTSSIEWNDGGKPFFAKMINAKLKDCLLYTSPSPRD